MIMVNYAISMGMVQDFQNNWHILDYDIISIFTDLKSDTSILNLASKIQDSAHFW